MPTQTLIQGRRIFFLFPCVCLCPSPAPSSFPHLYLSPSSAPLSPWQHWHHVGGDSPTVVVLIQRWVTDTHLRTSLWKRHLRICTATGQNTKWLSVYAELYLCGSVELRRERGRTIGLVHRFFFFNLIGWNKSFVSSRVPEVHKELHAVRSVEICVA